MFSQYSWWDLTKIVLVALVIYYTYVLWTYYREDIREWLSNRGQKPVLDADGGELADEDDSESLYAVSQYAPVSSPTPAIVTTAEAAQSSTPAVELTPSAQQPIVPSPVTKLQDEELTLSGPALHDESPAESDFSLAMGGDYERPDEHSLTTLMTAAGKLQADENGLLTPTDPSDKTAQKIADVVNQQQGRSALAGFPFNR